MLKVANHNAGQVYAHCSNNCGYSTKPRNTLIDLNVHVNDIRAKRIGRAAMKLGIKTVAELETLLKK